MFREAIRCRSRSLGKTARQTERGTGQVHNFELQLRHKDGALRWSLDQQPFSLDANGGLLGIEDPKEHHAAHTDG